MTDKRKNPAVLTEAEAAIPDVVAVARPDPALLTAAEAARAMAESYEITSAPMFEAAAEDLAAIKGKAKELEAKRVAITKPLDDAKKAVMDLFRGPLAFLAEAEAVLKRKMIAYQEAEEKERRAEEARIAEENRKRQEALAAQAAKLEAKGKVEQAEAKREEAAAIPTTVVLAPAAPKVAGLAATSTWRVRRIDLAALVKAAAERPELLVYLAPNEKVIGQTARAHKGATAIPGVEVEEVKGIAARSA